jgi:hypothetical protein
MKRLTGIIPVFLLILAVVTTWCGTASAAVNSGGVLGKFKGVTETMDNASSTSTTWADVSGMTRTFNMTKKSRLVITFSAEAAAAGAVMYVRCRINGSDVDPSEIQFTANTIGEAARTKSFTWISDVLDPVKHTVNIQFRSSLGGELVRLYERTLLIQFKK